MIAKIFICSLAIVCVVVVVDSQICTKMKVAYKTIRKTYSEYRRQTYHGECYYGCILTRWTTVTYERTMPIRVVSIDKFCCDGYIRADDFTDDSNITCNPVCVPPCKNGYCKSPGVCACNSGYIPFEGRDTRNCLPTCPEGACDHGTCIAPNTCECNAGYTFLNQTCQPICSEPCHNGTCIAPDICQCLAGYRKSESNICEPYCSSGCENGTCIEPERCQCNPGYHMTQNNSTLPNQSCAPFCNDSCHNGVCVAPNTCNCSHGYRKMENNTCEPYCSSGCKNGRCVEPETCRCNPGYSVYDDIMHPNNSCAPVCIDSCHNGTCVAPDTCQCLNGYKTSGNNICKPHCSNGCENGTCVAPETCECNLGWQISTTNDNSNESCQPVCSEPCGNGTCVAPDTCQCFSGYEWNSTCVPQCSKECNGGKCKAPDVCECLPDWEYKDDKCVPKCRHACGNGTCVSPDVCQCWDGYKIDLKKLSDESLDELSDSDESPKICTDKKYIYEEGDYETEVNETTNLPNSLFNNTEVYGHYLDNITTPKPFDDENELHDSNASISHKENYGQKATWVHENWPVIVAVVSIVIVAVVVLLVVMRWTSVYHYFKGHSYIVEETSSNNWSSTKGFEASFLDLKEKDRIKDRIM